MGCADIVPGVSGGTIAFILGIYNTLLQAIQSFNLSFFTHLIKGRFKEASSLVPWSFVLPLFLGIITSISVLARGVHFFLNDPYLSLLLFSAFMGLIVASFYTLVKETKKLNATFYLFCLLGVVCGFFFSSLKPIESQASTSYQLPIENYSLLQDWAKRSDIKNYDHKNKLLTQLSESQVAYLIEHYPELEQEEIVQTQSMKVISKKDFIYEHSQSQYSLIFLFFCGFSGAAAMLAPGISGSYLMLVIGVYPFLISSYVDFLKTLSTGSFDSALFACLAVFILGVISGLACFSRVLSYLLKTYHQASFALLAGFILGSIRALWPFWTYHYKLNPLQLSKGPILYKTSLQLLPSSLVDAVSFVLLFSVAFYLVFLLERIGRRSKQP